MKGASVSVANKNGDTPIHFACRSDVDEHCLSMLMSIPDAEKTLVAENMSGHVPLHLGKYFKICQNKIFIKYYSRKRCQKAFHLGFVKRMPVLLV